MPKPKPSNYLCFYVECDRIWSDYSVFCEEYKLPVCEKKDFVRSVKEFAPEAEIVDRCGEKIFINLEYQPEGIE